MSGMTLEQRVTGLEQQVGKLSLRIEQFARTGIADSDNTFYCSEDFSEEAECRKWEGVFGSPLR